MSAGPELAPVLLLGGTTEGHRLAEYLAGRGQPVILCVATEYGREVLGGALGASPWLDIRVGRLDAGRMAALLARERPGLVIDATHPYADQVTRNLREACGQLHIAPIRCLRPADENREPALRFPDCGAAAAFLADREGGVLITTGSKELAAFSGIPDFERRVYARVLPTAEALAACLAVGLKGRHIIAMQGPFTRETNVSQLREFGCGYLVTKDTGNAGGCREKVQAAREAGAAALVIARPGEEQGLTVEQVIDRYERWRKTDGR